MCILVCNKCLPSEMDAKSQQEFSTASPSVTNGRNDGKKRDREENKRALAAEKLAAATVAHGIDLAKNASLRRYVDENGMRCVEPYLHNFPCFVKQRWRGRQILEVFTSEFDSHDEAYFRGAIQAGCITVNGKAVSIDYTLKNGDQLLHTLHRHEPGVPSHPISWQNRDWERYHSGLASDRADDPVVAIYKPAGIPVHPCGPHQYLSLLGLMHAELKLRIQNLHPIHRLDRLTSGIVLFARWTENANKLSAQMRGSAVKKRYLALVEGEFPLAPGAPDAVVEQASPSDAPALCNLNAFELLAPGSRNASQPRACEWCAGPCKSPSFQQFVAAASQDCDWPASFIAQRRLQASGPPATLCLPVLHRIGAVADPELSSSCVWLRNFRPHPVVTYWLEGDQGSGGGDDGDRYAGSRFKGKSLSVAPVAPTTALESSGVAADSMDADALVVVPPKRCKSVDGDVAVGSNENTGVHTAMPRAQDDADGGGSGAGLLSSSSSSSASQFQVDPRVAWTSQGYLRVAVAVKSVSRKNAVNGIAQADAWTPAGYNPNSTTALDAGTTAPRVRTSEASTPQSAAPAVADSSTADKDSVTLFRRLVTFRFPQAGTTCTSNTGSGASSSAAAAAEHGATGERAVSLVEVLPLSGRTHQIRLHAAWLGHPIADDPVYCKRAARELLSLNKQGCGGHVGTAALPAGTDSSSAAPTPLTGAASAGSIEAAAKSLCVFCNKGEAAEFNPMQRLATGISLHSIEYEGPPLPTDVRQPSLSASSDSSSDSVPNSGPAGVTATSGWRYAAPFPEWVSEAIRLKCKQAKQ